jgi:hypothetical protein
MGSVIGIQTEEEAPHKVLLNAGNFEIREYDARNMIETSMQAETDSDSFMTLAGYIFGKNDKKQKIAMTVPVEMRGIGHHSGNVPKIMRFTLPRDLKHSELPIPTDPNVKILQAGVQTVATLQFSGFLSKSSVAKQTEMLLQHVRKCGFETVGSGEIITLVYNAPLTLPFRRRNEVAVEVRPVTVQ